MSQDHDDLPSASDYSDLESPHEGKVVHKLENILHFVVEDDGSERPYKIKVDREEFWYCQEWVQNVRRLWALCVPMRCVDSWYNEVL